MGKHRVTNPNERQSKMSKKVAIHPRNRRQQNEMESHRRPNPKSVRRRTWPIRMEINQRKVHAKHARDLRFLRQSGSAHPEECQTVQGEVDYRRRS